MPCIRADSSLALCGQLRSSSLPLLLHGVDIHMETVGWLSIRIKKYAWNHSLVKGAAKPESNDGGAVGAGDTVDGGGLARARCLFDTVHVDASEAGV